MIISILFYLIYFCYCGFFKVIVFSSCVIVFLHAKITTKQIKLITIIKINTKKNNNNTNNNFVIIADFSFCGFLLKFEKLN